MNVELVELFAGPGGMSLAARQLGIKGVGIEWCPNAVDTRRAAGLATVHGDVRDYGPKDFPGATMLAGGPPCQTFSLTGKGAGRRDLDTVLRAVDVMERRESVDASGFTDERTSLVLEPLRWALEAMDQATPYGAVVLEQVPQALPVWDAYAAVLRREGYSVATGVVRAEQYGLAQTRKRAVLVARLHGEAKLPTHTHRPYRKGVSRFTGDPDLTPWTNMREALRRSDLFTVHSNYSTGGTKTRGTRTQDEPASTVTRPFQSSRLYGPDGTELHRFTFAEIGVLQGFPRDYPWSARGTRQQLGNACPPPLARALFKAAQAN